LVNPEFFYKEIIKSVLTFTLWHFKPALVFLLRNVT